MTAATKRVRANPVKPLPQRSVQRSKLEFYRTPAAKTVTVAKAKEGERHPYQTSRAVVISYSPTHGVDSFVQRISEATPMELVDVERHGVKGRFIKDFSKKIGVSAVRFYEILGVPKATVEKRSAEGTEITGAGGQAAVAMAKLLAKAREIVDNSTSPAAKDFDAAKWLGQWIERPQPALGGRKPAELIGTPTGAEMVSRLLGSIESGAYQ
ncbi:antitoxin Xre/MbcA/ParS toxin-binding domain-containing protein [Piscinibacter sp.]|uniref:antitoxin Xre/MbcA/ParS toxin-binding domain-containing protein n=1 Tax=Piscinibacter sp. TaxID=1903157 RepID=UPI002CAD3F34|nr:antitoxin Xre/MbcA/ParS toxin-binding domain-containing protein [Albitalea sp.]HUG23971.1 antitoxin Xre/MbcA/ParS toxin-binding domain-containing protein [Albitalea sp.]